MDLDLSEEQQLIRQTARDFTRREIAPKAAEIDEKWLSEKIDSKEISISHFRYDGRLILTAGTDELQQAVNGLAGVEGAFAELQVLRRVK